MGNLVGAALVLLLQSFVHTRSTYVQDCCVIETLEAEDLAGRLVDTVAVFSYSNFRLFDPIDERRVAEAAVGQIWIDVKHL
jgi:hypothetical protein